ncbi:MAG: arabinogalactan endo-1,4-beta-galactosidase [Fibrobacter sp.]|nr:arabinogalactan endo-1,4-beta-galactosidase [Fibrobacter sp.]
MGLNKKRLVFAMGCFGLLQFLGCGDSASSADAVIPESSSDELAFDSSAEALPSSSAQDLTSSAVPQSASQMSSAGLPSSAQAPISSAESSSSAQTSSTQMSSAQMSSMQNPSSAQSSAVLESSSALESSSTLVSSSTPTMWINPSPYWIGADISKFQEYENKGTKLYDTDGTEKNIFEILAAHGFNAIRLKTFVGPKTQYGYGAPGCGQDSEAFGDKDHVVDYIKRAKAYGFRVLLDFHYSDNWADPGKQIIPERWRSIRNSNEMADSVYAYTYDVVNTLKLAGATPDMVQVGNEITNGLLRDVPKSNTDCWGNNVNTADASVSGIMSNSTGKANTAKYLKAGVKAVKDVSTSIKTSFHIENPEKTSTIDWWMKEIFQTQKVTADAMGISAYTAYDDGNPSTWKSLLTNLGKTYTNLEFFIAEYNGGEKINSYSFNGSRLKTHQIMEEVPRGLGAFFWEPGESGEWGPALFDWKGSGLYANKKAFDEYAPLIENHPVGR